MSAAVLDHAEAGPGRVALRFIARRPDFVVLFIALPVFIAAEWPIVAWGVVTVLWTLQFALQLVLDDRVKKATNPRQVMGLLAGGALARGWSVATALLITGLIDERTGMFAIVLTMIVFTSYFIAKLFSRLFEESEAVNGAAS
ncbi:MAG: hypothetical protein WAP35_06065 [Solirubrobacterales bacterium]